MPDPTTAPLFAGYSHLPTRRTLSEKVTPWWIVCFCCNSRVKSFLFARFRRQEGTHARNRLEPAATTKRIHKKNGEKRLARGLPCFDNRWSGVEVLNTDSWKTDETDYSSRVWGFLFYFIFLLPPLDISLVFISYIWRSSVKSETRRHGLWPHTEEGKQKAMSATTTKGMSLSDSQEW